MKVRHLILMLLDAYGGAIFSKTKIQKAMYFISLMLKKDIGFNPHYYGPYSTEVERGLDELIGAGFLDMSCEVFGGDTGRGFEFKRYSFTLTSSGQNLAKSLEDDSKSEYAEIKKLVEKLQEVGDPDYLTLSIAAKVYYILDKEGKPMKSSSIKEKAQDLGWNSTDDDMNKAVDVLNKLGFVRRS